MMADYTPALTLWPEWAWAIDLPVLPPGVVEDTDGVRGWKVPDAYGNVFEYRRLNQPVLRKGAQGLWRPSEAVEMEIAIGAAEVAAGRAGAELKDATAWLNLPKAARKRILAMAPETVAAFCDTPSTVSSERGDEWLALKLKKKKVDHIFMRTCTSYPDTPEGAGVRIRCLRGAEWCENLEADNA